MVGDDLIAAQAVCLHVARLDRYLMVQRTGRYTIADIAVYAYAHVAAEASVDTDPYQHFRAWLRRVESQPGFIDDLAPYPPNASVLAGASIYG